MNILLNEPHMNQHLNHLFPLERLTNLDLLSGLDDQPMINVKPKYVLVENASCFRTGATLFVLKDNDF